MALLINTIYLIQMNWEKVNQYYSCGLYVARRIGARNIIFFGLLGTAVAANLFLGREDKPYYGWHLFKRVKPTQTIYEHPY